MTYLDRRMADLWLRSLGSEKAMLLKQVAEERAKHEAENAELSRGGQQILFLKMPGVMMQLLSLRPK